MKCCRPRNRARATRRVGKAASTNLRNISARKFEEESNGQLSCKSSYDVARTASVQGAARKSFSSLDRSQEDDRMVLSRETGTDREAGGHGCAARRAIRVR